LSPNSDPSSSPRDVNSKQTAASATLAKQSQKTFSGPNRKLRLRDAISIIVGTIIGAAIFRLPPLVAMQVDSLAMLAVAWIAGGLIALSGSLCFAELTTAYNEDGGDYVYLRQAFGRYTSFMFAWTAGWIVRPANVAAMAITFAMFAQDALPGVREIGQFATASIAVLLLAGLNLMGISAGKRTQNILTLSKVGGLLLLCIIGLLPTPDAGPAAVQINVSPASSDAQTAIPNSLTGTPKAPVTEAPVTEKAAAEAPSSPPTPEVEDELAAFGQAGQGTKDWTVAVSGLMMALVFVLYTFGGWNDISFVAAEIQEPQKNLPRALLGGLAIVTTIYLLVNYVMIANLGLDGLAGSQNAPADVVTSRLQAWGWGNWVKGLLGLMVSLSCLGAVNAMLITSPRIYYAAGQEHNVFAWLGGWDKATQVPARALLAQTVATILLLAVCAGLSRAALDDFSLNTSIFKEDNPFEELVSVSSPFFWLFLALVGLSLIVLRQTDPNRARPVMTIGYPITPLIFTISSLFMLYKSVQYVISQQYAISGFLVLSVFTLGLILGLFSKRPTTKLDAPEPAGN